MQAVSIGTPESMQHSLGYQQFVIDQQHQHKQFLQRQPQEQHQQLQQQLQDLQTLFWLVVLAGCCLGTYRLTTWSYYAYQHHGVSFVTETDYLHWNTSFPQIVVCETERVPKSPTTKEFVMKNFPEYKTDWTFASVIHSVVFGLACFDCSHYCNGKNAPICDIKLNLKEMARKVRWPCEKLIKECVWNGEPFDCCSKFEAIETELGICFSTNPSGSESKPPIMVVNKDTGLQGTEFKVTRRVQVYLMAPDDVASSNTKTILSFIAMKSSLCKLIFTMKDMKNDNELVHEEFERRKCKFPHETESKRFDRYSKLACVVDCRANYQLRLCNCTHHNTPKSESTMCNIQGLKCLHKHKNLLSEFRLKGAAYRPGIECDCPPSCVEPEYNVVYKECNRISIPYVLFM